MLLAICASSLEMKTVIFCSATSNAALFRSFGLFFFDYRVVRVFIYSRYKYLITYMIDKKILFHSVGYPYIFLMLSFDACKFLISIISNLSIFSFCCLWLLFIFKNMDIKIIQRKKNAFGECANLLTHDIYPIQINFSRK